MKITCRVLRVSRSGFYAWCRRVPSVSAQRHETLGHRIREVADALEMALTHRRPGRGLLHHSDRGAQYASDTYQGLLMEHGIECSMSRRGKSCDTPGRSPGHPPPGTPGGRGDGELLWDAQT